MCIGNLVVCGLGVAPGQPTEDLRRARCRFTPEAAVRAVPPRLLLLCLLLRRSWLTVEGGRQSGDAGLLIVGARGQPWPCPSGWLLAFHSGSLSGSNLANRCCWLSPDPSLSRPSARLLVFAQSASGQVAASRASAAVARRRADLNRAGTSCVVALVLIRVLIAQNWSPRRRNQPELRQKSELVEVEAKSHDAVVA